MERYLKDATGKFVGSVGAAKKKVPSAAPVLPKSQPRPVEPQTSGAKAAEASYEALLARMDLFALNITTSMDDSANAAGRATTTGRLLGAWRHGVVSELLRLRNVFTIQHKRIMELENELKHPLNLPRVTRGWSSYHVEGVKGVTVSETADPDVVRKIGAAFIAIAGELEKNQAARADEYMKKGKNKNA